MKLFRNLMAVALGGALVAGCGTSERVRDIYEGERAEGQMDSGQLSPGEVYSAAKALNERELEVIAAAKGRLDDPGIVAFADKLEADHRDALKQLEGAATEDMAGQDGELARQIREEGQDAADDIGDERGDDLDEKFIDTVVRDHQRALNIIDNQLLPSASGDVLPVISSMRQHVVSHLDQAKKIQDSLD